MHSLLEVNALRMASILLFQGSHVSSITFLYVICRLLQVVDGRELVNSVAFALIYSYMFSFVKSNAEKGALTDGEAVNHFTEHLIKIEEITIPVLEHEGAENFNTTNLIRLLSEYISANCLMDNIPSERLVCIFY